MKAVEDLDAHQLRSHLERAALELTQPRLLQMLLVPLISSIGELWEEGSLRMAHEHLATAVLQAYLTGLESAITPPRSAPVIVVCTPKGQVHEMGALLASATAAAEGWKATYLGSGLPAGEIAAAAQQTTARAVALSIVYPADDPHLPDELRKLRRLMDPETALILGGRAAKPYVRALGEGMVHSLPDMPAFRAELRALRETVASA